MTLFIKFSKLIVPFRPSVFLPGLFFSEILSLEIVQRLVFRLRIQGEVSEGRFSQLGQLLVRLVRLLLAHVQDHVDVGIRHVRVLGREDAASSVTNDVQHFVLTLVSRKKQGT